MRNNRVAGIPGFSGKLKQGAQIDEKQIARTKAIIQSMTPKERRNPEIIKASQKKRISKGSGTSIQEVNQLLKQFENWNGSSLCRELKGISTGRVLRSCSGCIADCARLAEEFLFAGQFEPYSPRHDKE